MKKFLLTIAFVATVVFGASATNYKLVTSAANLANGDKVIIVNTDGSKALSTTQNPNNRGAADVTISGDIVADPSESVQVITLVKNGDNWNLNVGTGYLYAASNSSNHLKTEAEADSNGNANAAITITDAGVATIKFQGDNSRNLIQYNSSSTLFSCYGGATQKAVSIYKEEVPVPGKLTAPVISPYSGYVKEGTKVSITNPADNEAKVYVSMGEEIEADELAAPKISDENVFAADSSLTINAYTVVKAFCATINGADTVCSDTVTATYKLIPVLPDLSSVIDLADMDPTAPFIMDCPLKVFYSNNGNVYVTDGTYNGLIYGKGLSFEAGAVIKGGWEGNLKDYNGIIEFIPNDVATVTSDSVGVAPQPRPIEAADVAMTMMPNNKLAYVTLQNVHFDTPTPAEKGFTGYVVPEPEDTTFVAFYNTFKIDTVPAGVYFVTGIVSCYNTDMQLIPIKYEEPYLRIAFDNETAKWDSVYVYAVNAEGEAIVAWPGQKMEAEKASIFAANIVTTDELAAVCFSNGASEDIDSLQQTGMLEYIADKEYRLAIYDLESVVGQYQVKSFTGKVSSFYDKAQTAFTDIDMQPWMVTIAAAPEIANGIVIKKFLNAVNEEADSVIATVNLADSILTIAPQIYLDDYLLANDFTNLDDVAPFVGTIEEDGSINLIGFNVYDVIEATDDSEEGDVVALFEDVDYTIEKYTDSITGITTDHAGPTVYYNLQGMKVQTPAKGGIYIRVQGKTASKVIIK